MSKRWKTSKATVHNTGYPLIWCPKYRRSGLQDGGDRLKELLEGKANELGIEIDRMEVMPDHVHLIGKADPTFAPHHIVQQFKGYTSRNTFRILRKEVPSLKSRLPSLWTCSYYVESVGHISEETIRQYVADQKNQ